MRKLLWQMLLASPSLVLAQAVFSPSAMAGEMQANAASEKAGLESIKLSQTPAPTENLSVDEFMRATEQQSLDAKDADASVDSISQVTSVSQFSDVQPTDWAFQALQSLVERYGCIAGYPDGTYRGNRALTRYEFAAGLNACLDQVLALVGGGDEIDPESLATIRRLQEEFAAELATLRGRVDALEARTAELEANQFSTTTKLQGEVVFGLANGFGDSDPGQILSDGTRDRKQTVFQDRVRLNFITNFDERQQLWTRLDASNSQAITSTGQGATTYQTSDNGNDVTLGWLAYYYNGDKFQVYLPAAFPLWQDFVPTVSPYFDGFTGGNNSLSSFGESNPIYKIGLAAGGGLGFNYFLSDNLTFSAGYFGGDSFDPSAKNGLFNGEYSALGQLTFQSEKFQLGLTYANAYFNEFGGGIGEIGNLDGNAIFDTLVGTSLARNPFGTPTITNSYGASAAFTLSPKFSISAFGGFTDARAVANFGADAQIWYYGLGMAFPDFGGDGNLLGLQAGVEPYVGGYDNTPIGELPGDKNPISIQGFYRLAVNDNINVTPGVIALINADGQDDNTAVIGVIRTTFNF
jgi:Carbohydrate-selective porin, OprB family/S-layer homology domain